MFNDDLDRAAARRLARALNRAQGPDDIVEGATAAMMGAFAQAVVAQLGPIQGRGLLLALVKLVDDHANGPACDDKTCTIHADIGETLKTALGPDATCLAPVITETLQLSRLTPTVFAKALDYLIGLTDAASGPGPASSPMAS